MRLLPPESRVKGAIEFEGKNLLELNEKEMTKTRGKVLPLFYMPIFSSQPGIFNRAPAWKTPSCAPKGKEEKKALFKAVIALKNMGFSNLIEYINGTQ